MAAVTLGRGAGGGAALTGAIEQIPPMVSAVKVDGPTTARTGPPGDRGGAGRPPGDRPPVRCRPRRRTRESSGSRWSARRAPTSGPWPPTSGRPSVAAPTCGTCGGPGSARSPSTTPGRWTQLTPAVVLTPAQALRDLDQVVVPTEVEQLVTSGPAARPGPSRGQRRRSVGSGRRPPPPAGGLRGHRHRPDPPRGRPGGGRMSRGTPSPDRPAGLRDVPAGGR